MKNLRNIYKELISEATQQDETKMETFLKPDPFLQTAVIEMCCQMANLASIKSLTHKNIKNEEFVKIRDGYIMACEEFSDYKGISYEDLKITD